MNLISLKIAKLLGLEAHQIESKTIGGLTRNSGLRLIKLHSEIVAHLFISFDRK